MANDGDSFHVKANDRHYFFRLYLVDTPETDIRYPDRVHKQAQYFGLTDVEALQVGKEAARFTNQTLSRGGFTVVTKRQDARGESKKKRYYAYILIGEKDLGSELVANGLARVFGSESRAPGDLPIGAQKSKLQRLQEIAKAQKVGAWGMRSGGLQKRAQSSEKFDRDAFDRFFHPEKFTSP